MKKNIGKTDKIIRATIGILIGIGFASNIITGTRGIILLVIGAILLITSITGFCGLYTLLGINTTCKACSK